MKVAIVGSRGLNYEIPEKLIPKDATLIVSGGCRGVDIKAREYAYAHNIQIHEILPDYQSFGRSAPIRRNCDIIAEADTVIAFWDGKSNGTSFVIDRCKKMNKPCYVYSEEDMKKALLEQE